MKMLSHLVKSFIQCYLITLIFGIDLARSQNSLTPLDSALIGCYPFSGDANDHSGNGINGTVNGAVLTSDRFGNPNSAYSFNGNTSTANILIPNFSSLLINNEFSISFWATTTGYSTRAAFLMVPDNINNRLAVCVYYGSHQFNSQVIWDFGDIQSTGRLTVNGSPIPSANTWDHWVFITSQTGNDMRCYKNGVLQSNKTGSSVFSNTPLTSLSIGGGLGVGNSNLWYDGKLDDIRIYNRTLLPSEITYLFNNNINCVPCPTITAPTNITGNNTFCLGDPITLSAMSSSTVHWFSSGNSSISISSGTTFSAPAYSVAGVYTLYTKSVNDCTVSIPLPVSFTVNSRPNIHINATHSMICQGETIGLSGSGGVSYTWQPGNMQTSIVLVSPVSNTIYSVTGIDNNACTNTTTYSVFVNGLPTIQVNSTKSLVCQGENTGISVTGGTSYTWQPGNMQTPSVLVSPASNTTYTVTGMDNNGCANTTTYPILVNGLPTIQINSTNSLICLGETATLSVAGGISYTWHPGSMQTSSVVVSPASNTTYTVTGIDNNTCTNTALYQVFISTCTGEFYTINKESIACRIYPNPARESLTIELLVTNEENAKIELMDVQGRLIHESSHLFTPDHKNVQLDISTLSRNLYYVKVSTKIRGVSYFMLNKE